MATKEELRTTIAAMEEAAIEIMTDLAERFSYIDVPEIHDIVEHALEDMQVRLNELAAEHRVI
jgi:hypothetical protein